MTLGRCPLSIFCSRSTPPINPESVAGAQSLRAFEDTFVHLQNSCRRSTDTCQLSCSRFPKAFDAAVPFAFGGAWVAVRALGIRHGVGSKCYAIQGYLAHKTPPPPRTLVGLYLGSYGGPKGGGCFLWARYPCTSYPNTRACLRV